MISREFQVARDVDGVKHDDKPFPELSLVIPVFNEQGLMESHLAKIVRYLKTLENEFRLELVIVNDGSIDDTARITNEIAQRYENVFVLHHPRNFGLGQALRFSFNNTRGDYIVTFDIDLSYDVEHIGEVGRAMRDRGARRRTNRLRASVDDPRAGRRGSCRNGTAVMVTTLCDLAGAA